MGLRHGAVMRVKGEKDGIVIGTNCSLWVCCWSWRVLEDVQPHAGCTDVFICTST